MNKNAHVIAISHEKLSSMAEAELREAMQTELNQIEAECNCQKKAIADDYEPYIKAAKDRQGFDKLNMLRKLIEEMGIADVRLRAPNLKRLSTIWVSNLYLMRCLNENH